MTVQQILQLPDDAILYSVKGTLKTLYPAKKNKPGDDREWSFQNGTLVDAAGDEIKITFKDREELPVSKWKGKPVTILAHQGGKGWSGVYKKTDDAQYGGKPLIHVTKTGEVVPGFSAPEEGAPASAPTGQKPTPQSQQASKPATIDGRTVGMAVNNTCAWLISKGEPLDPKRIHEIASGIIRVTLYMEKGNLTPKPEDPKAKDKEPTTKKCPSCSLMMAGPTPENPEWTCINVDCPSKQKLCPSCNQPLKAGKCENNACPTNQPKCQDCGAPLRADKKCPNPDCRSNDDVPF